MSFDVDGIESEVRDLERIYETAISLPGADPTRIAVIGRSWGAVPAVVFAHRNHETDALVSLDGTISYNMDQLLETFPQLPRGEEHRVPSAIMVGLQRPDGATPIDRSYYFEKVIHVDAHHVDYVDLPHAGFSSAFLDRSYYGASDPDEIEGDQAVVDGYHRMLTDVLDFLNAYVKGASADPGWSSDDVRTVSSRLNGPPLPSWDDFSRTAFDFGFDAVVTLCEKTFAKNPEHRMFNVWTLNRIIAEYTARGDYETAEAFATFALDRYEDKAVLHVTRGRARDLAGDRGGALASFDAALNLDSGNREATLLRTRLLDKQVGQQP
jgi:dienelactone hydrolase